MWVEGTAEFQFFLKFGVGDCGGGFDVGRGDDSSGGDRGLRGGFVGHAACNAEEFEEIVELAVDVAADCDWSRDWLYV